jgi:hypothetical protein
MKNSKKLEKSRGIVAFAYNVDSIDYVSIAKSTLELASKKLGLPYTLITDSELKNENYTMRHDIDTGEFIKWRNIGRHHAYELSPYDETLVIDADYLVLDNNLNKIFNIDWDYLLARDSQALTVTWPNQMGDTSLPYVWATVFAFRKTLRAKMFFDLVGRIQRNYSYYRALFNIDNRNFRNDFAFAIADVILNGYTLDKKSIPGNVIAVDQSIDTMDIIEGKIVVKDKNKSYVLPCTNLHVMSKAYLQSNNFKNFVSQIINES